MKLKVKLSARPGLQERKRIASKVDGVCRYLADYPESRQGWAIIIDEFRDWDVFLDNVESTSEYSQLHGREYIEVFKDARKERNQQLLNDLIGAVPEGMVFHLLEKRLESKGKTKREVYVEITTDNDFWSSSKGRTKAKSLDVAFWDSTKRKGRGFECKIADVKRDVCSAVVELLSIIYEMTDGLFETVLFSFCLASDTLYQALSRNINERERNKLSNICFIGSNHLEVFDGTTSCCRESSRGFFPGSPRSSLSR